MATRTKSMTEGAPARLIIAFALPLMAGNIFQQLYTVVDTLIVGRYLGVRALAALGADDWFAWLMLGIVQGFAQGFAIKMAHDFGAKDYQALRKTVGNSVVIAVLFSVCLVVLGELLVVPGLSIVKTNPQVWEGAVTYLRLYYLGAPVMMMYNLFASILRSLGDSKTPLHAVVVASISNIFLDLLFVVVLKFGIAGAALGTILGQLVSCIYCFYYMRKMELLKLTSRDFKLDAALGGRLLYLGLPMAAQNGMIAIGGMFVQSVVNQFSVAFVAGFTAVNKLYGLLEIAATSYGFSMVTYTGQNLGAGKTDRISEGVRSAVKISIVTSLVMTAIVLIFGKSIVGMFISGTKEEYAQAVDVGYRYISIMGICLPILYVLHVVRSTIQGLGNTVLPMVSGIAEFVMRTAVAMLLPLLIGELGIYFAEVAAWTGSVAILIPSYYALKKKMF